MVVDKRFGDFTLGRTVVGPWKEEFERIRTHLTPLECEIIVGSIPAGAISRKGGSIWGMRITLPPIPEQRAIANYLDNKTARIDALSQRAETAIKLLNEYRTALINAAVTGKIDLGEPPTV